MQAKSSWLWIAPKPSLLLGNLNLTATERKRELEARFGLAAAL